MNHVEHVGDHLSDYHYVHNVGRLYKKNAIFVIMLHVNNFILNAENIIPHCKSIH